ncbi:hypothetical protein L1887_58059 [Cichorium endivia]|nr:hypothetical protein L1887_58059 [Cichorium endivia]
MHSLHRCLVEVVFPVILPAWLEVGAGNDVRSLHCTKLSSWFSAAVCDLARPRARALRKPAGLDWTSDSGPGGRGKVRHRSESLAIPDKGQRRGEARMRCENRLQLRKRNGGSSRA